VDDLPAMTQQILSPPPPPFSLAFQANCAVLTRARINPANESRKEGAIQRWLSTARGQFTPQIETIKLIFPENRIMQIIARARALPRTAGSTGAVESENTTAIM